LLVATDKLERDCQHEHVVLLLSVMPVLLQLLLLLLRFITFDPGIAAATVGSVTRVDLKRGRLF